MSGFLTNIVDKKKMKGPLIAFYISSHGFGHMTRSLAIIEELLNRTEYYIYIASGIKQNNFAQLYLDRFTDRVIFNDIQTEVGLINFSEGLSVDVNITQDKLYEFISNWDSIVNREIKLLNLCNVSFVVTDISPIGALVANKLNIKSYGISNFSWVEQYENLNIDGFIVDKFRYTYGMLQNFIEYKLSIHMNHGSLKKYEVGYVARKFDSNRIREISNTYGNSIFITCGKSANINDIKIKNYLGVVFITSGIQVSDKVNTIELPLDTLDTHNYIAASKLVIAKAGWGTISEALIAGRMLVLIERPDVYEDTFVINSLKSQKLAISIKESELSSLDIDYLLKKTNKEINKVKLKDIKNDVDSILRIFDF